jgi:hypothetical protein
MSERDGRRSGRGRRFLSASSDDADDSAPWWGSAMCTSGDSHYDERWAKRYPADGEDVETLRQQIRDEVVLEMTSSVVVAPIAGRPIRLRE